MVDLTAFISTSGNQIVSEYTEQELITALKLGDERAYRSVVLHYHNLLVYKAATIVGEAYAEEVVQECWESLFISIHSFRREASLKTWLLKVTVNKALNRQKKERRTESLDAILETEPDNEAVNCYRRLATETIGDIATPEAITSRNQLQAFIRETWQAMPRSHRKVLFLSLVQGYSNQKVACTLGISYANTKVILHRARIKALSAISSFIEAG